MEELEEHFHACLFLARSVEIVLFRLGRLFVFMSQIAPATQTQSNKR